MTGAPTPPLPPLRDDLALLPGPRGVDGAPSWTIHDPVRNRFHRIGARAFDLLSAWHLGAAEAVMEAVEARTGRRPTASELGWLENFLRTQSLVRQDKPEDVARMVQIATAGKTSWLMWLLHRYLFFRVPLVRPDRFLDATSWLVAPLFTRTCGAIILALGALGLILALHQWQTFTHTFMHFFDMAGMAWYGLAIVFTKIVHEMGHAYTAKRFGCRVPTMGVAFLVLWPVLYTDTTDTWRLPDRRRRMMVGAAGMVAELALAMIATFLWSFLPDGPARSAAFVVATVSWVMTLAVNTNPLMRFDGYYLLSDALGIPNLQDRAFALGQWKLREVLFGFGEAPPERLPRPMRLAMLSYAYATWVWRFFLFLGIAVLVYHMFFKALGVALFIVEIWWFLMKPIAHELARWWERRDKVRLNRHSLVTLAVLAGLVAVLVVPWQSSVSVPAMHRAAEHAWLFPPVPARIATLTLEPGARVAAGEVLATLAAPELEHEIGLARRRIAFTREILLRQAASTEAADNIHVLRRQLVSETTRLDGLLEQKERLTVRAPFDGIVGDRTEGMHPGRWVTATEPLGLVIAADATHLVGFVAETERDRLIPGGRGTFHPDDPVRSSFPVELVAIADVSAEGLDQPALTAPFGGVLAATVSKDGLIKPTQGVYRVLLRPVEAPHGGDLPQSLRGIARLDAEARSPMGRLWRHAGAVLIRESGL
ncbi:HlyD family efflux transporter periplasmic adaptor subunit [Novispirillum sp. DQ9]|uniref:HlyD family efflux transporter periplasmic adaptor subunit n=1 Tax=Novispirillum sp. DQ9 TaxID=3398612 RepID=UPI003C7AF95F